MRGLLWGALGACSVTISFNAAAAADLGTPVESSCPVAASEYGTSIRRVFTASDGAQLSFTLDIPSDFDPSVPHGIAIYFHGNSEDPDGEFYPYAAQVPANAQSRGLVIGAVRSPGTKVFDDGGIARNWFNKDDLAVEELLDSNFGGCLEVDKKRVVLVGGSNGTCFVSRMLTSFLWRNYAGGILGYCGCWPPQAEYMYPIDAEKLRNSFRVFIENQTEGFEYWNGPNGYEHLHYNLGLEVRTDLLRPGGHCENPEINGEAALDWLLGIEEYPPEFEFVPYWEQLDTWFNEVDSLVAIGDAGRIVRIQWEPHLTDEEMEDIGRRARAVDGEVDAFLDWRDTTYPEFQELKPRVFVSSDYGTTWQGGEALDTTVYDVLATKDGQFYLATESGVWRDDGTGMNYAPFTLNEQRVDALEQDEEGTLFAFGAQLSTVRRSKDDGQSWEELDAPTPFNYLYRERRMLSYSEGVLTMVQNDGTVLYSEDHGDTWLSATMPNDPVEFVHYGRTFYAIDAGGTNFVKSPDAGATWEPLTVRDVYVDAYMVVTPEGDLLIQGGETGYRSKDGGATFQREAGLNLVRGMDAAFSSDGHAIAAGLRGVFRYQTDPSALPDTSGLPQPPAAVADTPAAPSDASALPTVPSAPDPNVAPAASDGVTMSEASTAPNTALPAGSEVVSAPSNTMASTANASDPSTGGASAVDSAAALSPGAPSVEAATPSAPSGSNATSAAPAMAATSEASDGDGGCSVARDRFRHPTRTPYAVLFVLACGAIRRQRRAETRSGY